MTQGYGKNHHGDILRPSSKAGEYKAKAAHPPHFQYNCDKNNLTRDYRPNFYSIVANLQWDISFISFTVHPSKVLIKSEKMLISKLQGIICLLYQGEELLWNIK